jgi:hypothetical protein
LQRKFDPNYPENVFKGLVISRYEDILKELLKKHFDNIIKENSIENVIEKNKEIISIIIESNYDNEEVMLEIMNIIKKKNIVKLLAECENDLIKSKLNYFRYEKLFMDIYNIIHYHN